MFQTMLKSFRAAFVTSALTAASVTFLTSLAAGDAARDKQTEAVRAKPAAAVAAPVWPQTGAVRVIDTTRRAPSESAVQPAPARAAKRDRGAA